MGNGEDFDLQREITGAIPGRMSRQQVLAKTPWREWQNQVIRWASEGGWLVYAINDSRTQHWGTNTGFPDVLLLRGDRMIVAECKCGSGRKRKDQRVWLDAFEEIWDCEVYEFRPENGDAIRAMLLEGAPVRDQVIRASMASLVTQSMRAPARKRRGPQRVSRKGLSPRGDTPRLSE